MTTSTDLALLQALRLKGRLTTDAAAACTGGPAAGGLDALVAAGLAAAAGAAVRITPQGRDRLVELLDAERSRLDHAALTAAYEAFDAHNSELKLVVTAWQLRDQATPNDHTDPAYDNGVIARLAALHERFAPLLDRLVGLVPRLGPYRPRFGGALARVLDGDHAFVARPIADSYHTVWFELHEDLIGLLGRTRAAEAAAGRAV